MSNKESGYVFNLITEGIVANITKSVGEGSDHGVDNSLLDFFVVVVDGKVVEDVGEIDKGVTRSHGLDG